MSMYSLNPNELTKLSGKTVIITGGSSGIGCATAKIAHEYGANVIVGDWDEVGGKMLADELKDRVLFCKIDVSNWNDVMALFKAANEKFGIIHAVLSNAGTNHEDLFHERFDENGTLLPPSLKTLDVNLTGTIYVSRCAAHFFSKWKETRCHLIMTGSAASFIDTPPLYLYCASKAGILGFMRGLRTQLIKDNITVNMVAPWMTVTPMLPASMRNIWGSLPANDPKGVALALLLPIVKEDLNGKSLFVAGNRIVDFEDGLHETQPQWMGDELSQNVDEGQRRLIP